MRIRLPVARLVSVLLFAALCAIVAGWALQLLAPRAPIAPGGAVAQAQPPVDLRQAGQLFGGVPPTASGETVAPPSNIQVVGVVAAGDRSVVLLAIDGKPAKPFQVGESVADGLKLRSVSGDTVELDRAGQPMKLPAPARGSIAVLTSGPSAAGAGVPPRTVPASLAGTGQAPGPALPPLAPRTLAPSGAAAAPDPGQPPAPPQGAPPAVPPGGPPGGIVAPGTQAQ